MKVFKFIEIFYKHIICIIYNIWNESENVLGRYKIFIKNIHFLKFPRIFKQSIVNMAYCIMYYYITYLVIFSVTIFNTNFMFKIITDGV
jgi:hypothetical protein